MIHSQLNHELSEQDALNLKIKHFSNHLNDVSNKHASMKKKHLRAYQAELITKELNEAIMGRSIMHKIFQKGKSINSKLPVTNKEITL